MTAPGSKPEGVSAYIDDHVSESPYSDEQGTDEWGKVILLECRDRSDSLVYQQTPPYLLKQLLSF